MPTAATAPARPRAGGPPQPAPTAYLPQPARESLVAALVAIGALAVLALWAHDTPAVRGLGEELTAAGRITGLEGTYLILVTVVLMGRIPWLDRLVGMDRLAVWHRRLGEYSIGLLSAHAVLIIWGYASTAHDGVVTQGRLVVLTYPDVLAATAGLAILLAIGTISARAVRSRVSYHTWYFIHLYTYIAIALSFAHALATGADFATQPLNRALWIAMYVVAGSLLAWFRVVAPVRGAWRHRLRVAEIRNEGPGVFSIYITGHRLDELRAQAGQFFLWRFVTRAGWWQAHPFSLSAAPNASWLRISVKVAGDHTAELARLRPGTRVLAEGPYGAFTADRRTRRRVLLIGGGIGIAPLRALLESLPARPGELTMLYRASDEVDLVFRHEIDELAARRGARVVYLVGRRTQHPDPLGPRGLRTFVGPQLADHDVFLCGPPGMTDEVRRSLRSAGVPRRRIHLEQFEL